MISNTCDARRIGRLLGYTKHILVIIMVRERSVILLKIGRCVEHLRIYKVLQRGYISWNYLFFRKSKSFVKV